LHDDALWVFDKLNANISTASPNVIDRSTKVLHTCLRTRPLFVEHTDIWTIDRKFGRAEDGREFALPGLPCKTVSALRFDLLLPRVAR
jgi:hypothetical protein